MTKSGEVALRVRLAYGKDHPRPVAASTSLTMRRITRSGWFADPASASCVGSLRLLRTPIDEAVQHQAEASLHGAERHPGVLFVDEADDLLAVEPPPDIEREGSASRARFEVL